MAYKHFTLEERKLMEEYLKSGMTKGAIAQLLHKSAKTIYNEFERGKTEVVNENGSVTAQYSASKAEERYQTWLHSTKNNTLYYNTINEITRLLHEGKSPEVIASELKISKNTVYSYIKKGKVQAFTGDTLRQKHLTVKVFSNGHIILPQVLRKELNIKDGQKYKVQNNGAILTLTPVNDIEAEERS